MKDIQHDMKSAAIAGGVVGGFVGLVVYLWAAVTHIQPALVQQGGLSALKADLLTLGLSVLGGLEVSMGVGAVVGSLKALLLYFLIYLPVACCQKYCYPSPEDKYSGSGKPLANSMNAAVKPPLLQVVVEEPRKPSESSRTVFFSKPDEKNSVDSHSNQSQEEIAINIR